MEYNTSSLLASRQKAWAFRTNSYIYIMKKKLGMFRLKKIKGFSFYNSVFYYDIINYYSSLSLIYYIFKF